MGPSSGKRRGRETQNIRKLVATVTDRGDKQQGQSQPGIPRGARHGILHKQPHFWHERGAHNANTQHRQGERWELAQESPLAQPQAQMADQAHQADSQLCHHSHPNCPKRLGRCPQPRRPTGQQHEPFWEAPVTVGGVREPSLAPRSELPSRAAATPLGTRPTRTAPSRSGAPAAVWRPGHRPTRVLRNRGCSHHGVVRRRQMP